jgi:hypothetical protein
MNHITNCALSMNRLKPRKLNQTDESSVGSKKPRGLRLARQREIESVKTLRGLAGKKDYRGQQTAWRGAPRRAGQPSH